MMLPVNNSVPLISDPLPEIPEPVPIECVSESKYGMTIAFYAYYATPFVYRHDASMNNTAARHVMKIYLAITPFNDSINNYMRTPFHDANDAL
jgi:hypothetical protein